MPLRSTSRSPMLWCMVFFFYHDAMNDMARLAHTCFSSDLGREGGRTYLSFF